VVNELLTQTRRLGVGRDFHEMSLMLFDVQGHQPLGHGPQHPVEERFTEPIALVGTTSTLRPARQANPLTWRCTGRPLAHCG